MTRQTYTIEIITPCFCGGAEPGQRAEIRPASIRGQLRWWFRVLGGFKSLATRMSLREQEDMIFGSAAGEEGTAGMLMLRVLGPQPESIRINAEDLDAGMGTAHGYALFPLRQFGDADGKRGTISETSSFQVSIIWRGNGEMTSSLDALVSVWAHLGALGFRSRRAFGALQLKSGGVQMATALELFANSAGVVLMKLKSPPRTNWRDTSSDLLKWYRSWRQHGQMNRRWNRQNEAWVAISEAQKDENRNQPGFKYARRDHNEGLDVQGTGAPNPDPEGPNGTRGQTFRAALGLPIVQFFSSIGDRLDRPPARRRATVNWECSPNGGRFASPVILRPHKDAQGNWHALVIFVDARKWPVGKQVFLEGRPRAVSLDLYDAMKADAPGYLSQFP